MNFSVICTEGHQGKELAIDVDRETITVHDAAGTALGSVPWGAVIDQVLASAASDRYANCRAHARAPLAVKVRYTTPEGKHIEGLTGGIGGGGLFIESSAPLAPGTELTVQFALPDRPWEQIKAKAKVAWARNKSERYVMFPGMGIQFTEIDEKSQGQLVELVDALNRNRIPS